MILLKKYCLFILLNLNLTVYFSHIREAHREQMYSKIRNNGDLINEKLVLFYIAIIKFLITKTKIFSNLSIGVSL